MSEFHERRGELFVEGVALSKIADEVGTPTYVYSAACIKRRAHELASAFGPAAPLVCYSVKASSNLTLLKLFARLGFGFDIVSGGELSRVLRATRGFGRRKIVFSGLGKTADEMAAALKAGVFMFNVESAEELAALDLVGRSLKQRAPFAVRVTPDVDARTHPHLATGLRSSKFGLSFSEARRLYQASRAMRGVIAKGVDCHIGSQMTDLAPLKHALGKVVVFSRRLRDEGFELEVLDVGGGLGIDYFGEDQAPSIEKYARTVQKALGQIPMQLVLEPGRALVGEAGILLTRVLYRKAAGVRWLVVVDAGMNDLLRPALYEARHELRAVKKRAGPLSEVDIVGPVCESADVVAKSRRLALPKPGELLAIMDAGAYGMSMASTYNSRPRPAEVLVEGSHFQVIRKRESLADLWRGETG